MRNVRFHHLRSDACWLRCDHAGTAWHATTAAVRLAPADAVATATLDAAHRSAWLEAQRGAARLACGPGRCAPPPVVSLVPEGVERTTGADGWSLLMTPTTAPGPGGALRFVPLDDIPAAAHGDPRCLQADGHGRLWYLDRSAQRVVALLQDTLQPLAVLAVPAPLAVLAVAAFGLVGAEDDGALWLQPFGAEWRPLPIVDAPAGFRAIAASGADTVAAVLLHDDAAADIRREQQVLVVRACGDSVTARALELPDLRDAVALLLPDDRRLLAVTPDAAPGGRTRAREYRLESDHLAADATWEVQGHDGRALIIAPEGDAVLASTALGFSPFYRVPDQHVARGMVETYALDSGLHGCQWHRLFLDLCLPSGTSVIAFARCADDLPAEDERPTPRPAAGGGAPLAPHGELPLGSRLPFSVAQLDGDELDPLSQQDGWLPLGVLDRRALHADVPLPPGLAQPPADDHLRRAPAPTPVANTTLEGLFRNPPGRYLWVRVVLRGTRTRSPQLVALRASWPRPSLLTMLPRFWRDDPGQAALMDQALALFEGELTSFDERVAVLPLLFDPRLCPREALPWLARLVAFSFDARLGEPVRRRLLIEAIALYRARGTVRGLERLCSILAGCQATVIEQWRLRGTAGATLGGEGDVAAVLGHGLQLLPDPGDTALGDGDDAVRERHRRHAHRFTVALFRLHDPVIADIVEHAVEAWKPAHTSHRLCWLDAGLRMGLTTWVGFGTRLGDVERPRPAVLGLSALGASSTVGAPAARRSLGRFVGLSAGGGDAPHPALASPR